jgi:hypothetical protein
LSASHKENLNRENSEAKGIQEKPATDFSFFNTHLRQAFGTGAADHTDM